MSAAQGRMEGGEHVLPIRVYYEDTDAAGIVYHASYLRFAERGRTEMLRLAGIAQSTLVRDLGIAFAVRDCQIDYRAPARLDDLLEVRSRLVEQRGATLRAEQTIRRGGEDLVRMMVRVACVGRDGRPTRLPSGLRGSLERFFRKGE
jgi:acyl-CoA thioester hydrolase